MFDIEKGVPLGVRVLIKMKKYENKTKGGVFIPETKTDTEQAKEVRGEIVKLGELAFVDYDVKPSIGDIVILSRHEGIAVRGYKDNMYRVVKDSDCHMVISREDYDKEVNLDEIVG